MCPLLILLRSRIVTTFPFPQTLHPILHHLPRRMAPPSTQLPKTWTRVFCVTTLCFNDPTSNQPWSQFTFLTVHAFLLFLASPSVTASSRTFSIFHRDYINSCTLSFLIPVLSLQFILQGVFSKCKSDQAIPVFKSLQYPGGFWEESNFLACCSRCFMTTGLVTSSSQIQWVHIKF